MHREQRPAGYPPPVREAPPGWQYDDPRWQHPPHQDPQDPQWRQDPRWPHEDGWGYEGYQGQPPAPGGWPPQAPPPRGRPPGGGPRLSRARLVAAIAGGVMLLAAGAVFLLRGEDEPAGDAEAGGAATEPPLVVPDGPRAEIGVMPTEENTGVPAGLALRPSGPLNITEDGAVVEGLDVDGCVQINASNVTIRYSRIRCDGDHGILVGDGATNVVLEDVEIDGLGNPRGIAVGFGNYTLRRANIHNIGDGPRMSDNTVVESSFIHDIAATEDGHNDGMQSTDGSNIVVRGNRVENLNTQTSAVFIGADLGDIDSVLVEGNWLNGGGFTVYAGGDDYTATNVQVLNNKFGRDHVYGPLQTNSADTLDWRDNTYLDNGEPINP